MFKDELRDRRLRKSLEREYCFETVNIQESDCREEIVACKKVYEKPLHTRGSNDYLLIILAIRNKAEYLFSNDYDVVVCADAYREHLGMSKEDFITGQLASIIRFMHEQSKTIVPNRLHAEMNLNIFGQEELRNIYNHFLNQAYPSPVYGSSFTPTEARQRYEDYARNVIETYP